MGLLSTVGHRHYKHKIIKACFYLLLSAGAVGIIYPLLLVFGQSLSDRFDLRDNALLPRYLYDENELALKYIFSYSNKITYLASRYHRNSWRTHHGMRSDSTFLTDLKRTVKDQGFAEADQGVVINDFGEFKKSWPAAWLMSKSFRIEDWFRPFLVKKYQTMAEQLQKDCGKGTPPEWLAAIYSDPEKIQRILDDRHKLGICIMNHELDTDYMNFYAIVPPYAPNITVPVWRPSNNPVSRLGVEFTRQLPPEQTWLISSDTFYHEYLRSRFKNKIKLLNKEWNKKYKGFFEIVFPMRPPVNTAELKAWKEFIVKRWPRSLLIVPEKYTAQWRLFVQRRLKAKNDINALDRLKDIAGVSSWNKLCLPRTRPENAELSRYWCEFTFSGMIPAEEFGLKSPESGFRDFLEEKYDNDINKLNHSWRTAFASFNSIPLPAIYSDYIAITQSPNRLRLSFAVESFQRVVEYLAGRGRAFQNTLILVTLALLSALILNPIAAYSLSRFSMKHSHKILIFFLATMAFPPEVVMVPNFLLLRDAGLLNTFAALILPRMVNGFSIFLLKCFFDSLPKELYEAAEIDGASELQVFRMVAMPMVKPILAYIALGTFVLTYGGFMWAFVICPDPKMWTLMVWVYDFQSRSSSYNYVMASVLLVAIPPLVVFLCANRIIMKGIMVPSMK